MAERASRVRKFECAPLRSNVSRALAGNFIRRSAPLRRLTAVQLARRVLNHRDWTHQRAADDDAHAIFPAACIPGRRRGERLVQAIRFEVVSWK